MYFRFQVHPDVHKHMLIIWKNHHQKSVVTHCLGFEEIFPVVVLEVGCNDFNGKFLLLSQYYSVNLTGEIILLLIFQIPNFGFTNNGIEYDLFEQVGYLTIVYLGRFYLFFDIFFIVCQILIKFTASLI